MLIQTSPVCKFEPEPEPKYELEPVCKFTYLSDPRNIIKRVNSSYVQPNSHENNSLEVLASKIDHEAGPPETSSTASERAQEITRLGMTDAESCCAVLFQLILVVQAWIR